MLHELRLFFVALQFLTRMPSPRWVGFEPAWLNDSARHFPLVGALVGGAGAAVLGAASLAWPPAVAALLSIVATVWVTGGFHEDGFADSCDALGGSVTRERALEIMKDSRIGAYGAIGLVLMLGTKAAVLAGLVQAAGAGGAMAAVMWVHAASRSVPLWLMRRLPYAGDVAQAKARPMAVPVSAAGLGIGLGWVALATAVVLVPTTALRVPPAAVLASLAACTAVAVYGEPWLRRRLGGYTGDALGASQQLAELAALLVWLAVLRAGVEGA
ncbi:MAG TPA: adenosylcobinamide-GDP ribazoletransferase [Albitalea sp.]|nr:adenosylcobinamide-GDP ribazoletransferase [Albitalea sp.]